MGGAVETKLSVNLNKVALLRNQRDIGYPSVLDAARLVVQAGAHGITVHPRPDERHIRRTDVIELAALLRDELPPSIEYNIEGYPSPEFVALIGEVRPDQVTLVPDAPDQRTSDHGWDLARDGARLAPIIAELHGSGARVSLFLDPEPAQGVDMCHPDEPDTDHSCLDVTHRHSVQPFRPDHAQRSRAA